MKIIKKILKNAVKIFIYLIGKKNSIKLLIYTANQLGADRTITKNLFDQNDENLLISIYQKIGILNYGNEEITGERFVIEKILAPYYSENRNITIFDIGANIGNYSKLLRYFFEKSTIYAFEPLENIYIKLVNNLSDLNINCINKAVGSTINKIKIYNDKNEKNSELATFYKGSLSDLYSFKNIEEKEVDVVSIDSFCNENKIEQIDFLKIDVEGHELEVLKGAKKMIELNKISFIQFEFNEFNIFSRVFLKDFYDILKNYRLYRVKKDCLIPMYNYNSFSEIFKYQNILAVKNTIEIGTFL